MAVSTARDYPHYFGMTSDPDLRRASTQDDTRSKIDVDRAAAPVATTTNCRSSFAREKFVWLDQVRADSELTPLAFMLAYVLANLVNEREGYAWRSVARLAAECHVTEAGVKKVIRRLVERGHVSVELGNGRGKTNRYRWIISDNSPNSSHHEPDELRQTDRAHMEQHVLPLSGEKRTTAVTTIETKKGQLRFRKGATGVSKRGNPCCPNPY